MTTSLVILTGIVLALAVVSFVAALMPRTPRLDDALARISGEEWTASGPPVDIGPVGSRSERLGAAVYRHTPIALSPGQRRNLRLQDKSIAEFYSDKAVMALLGALLPALMGLTLGWLNGHATALPAVAGVLGAVVGFFVPDLLLSRGTRASRSSAVEALLVFIDLVTLERLANASATQALQNAATLSEATIFTQIRTALERAQLEQQPPYAELRRLSDQLDLPELTDIADVMQLDETGAALSGALRARVRELRDAHLAQEQTAASAAAEGMTLYMSLPALIFGLIFLAPPLMKIVLG